MSLGTWVLCWHTNETSQPTVELFLFFSRSDTVAVIWGDCCVIATKVWVKKQNTVVFDQEWHGNVKSSCRSQKLFVEQSRRKAGGESGFALIKELPEGILGPTSSGPTAIPLLLPDFWFVCSFMSFALQLVRESTGSRRMWRRRLQSFRWWSPSPILHSTQFKQSSNTIQSTPHQAGFFGWKARQALAELERQEKDDEGDGKVIVEEDEDDNKEDKEDWSNVFLSCFRVFKREISVKYIQSIINSETQPRNNLGSNLWVIWHTWCDSGW